MKTLAERMIWARKQKEIRDGREVSQQMIADLSGVSQGTIGNLESGRGLSARKNASIAKALGVDPMWLETGKGAAFNSDQKMQDPAPENMEKFVAHEADTPHLAYITISEALLVANYRAATKAGKKVIETFSNTAEKDTSALNIANIPKPNNFGS